MSGLWREMRPYLAVWRPIVRLTVGTWRLLGRVTSKCLAGEGSDKAWRALGLIALGEFVRRLAERAPLLTAVLTLVWLVLAWRAGKPAPAAKTTEPEPADDDQEQQDAEPEEAPLPDREQLAAALHHVGNPHAHLSALAAHLGLGKDTAPVRAALEQAGIPIDPVRVRGAGSSTGVKRDHFPPLLTSPDGVVVAGQPDNNNTEGRKPYLSQEGFWTQPDPQRPCAWHVRREGVNR